jgi:long-subunit acyl-CoA synthetase (AMP-forming)
LGWIAGPHQAISIAKGVAKVTFTSGTTGKPKGVCLSLEQQELTASALAQRTSALSIDTHLSILPLALLLENVAGVYGAIISGSGLVLPSLAMTGITGSSGFSAATLLDCIRVNRPCSLILLPQILKSIVDLLRISGRKLVGLKYVAVGGARTSPELIREARSLGLPVFEGYGLTECASVVAVNLPGADKPGSVGRPLGHRSVRIGLHGEIQVQCPEGVAFMGHAPVDPGWLKTGDLGYQDEEGFLYVNGRSKQVVITAFGRNVSPEWVESELLAEPEVMQTAIFGDDLPELVALIVAATTAGADDVEQAIARCNSRLPDYARIGAYRIIEPFTAASGQLTANGRACRSAIEKQHRESLDDLYREVTLQFPGAHNDVLPRTHSEI